MMVMKDPDREKWRVLRAQAGDRGALDELLQSIQEPLYRYIFNLVREESLAEDILQEVFIRIYRKLGWLREPELFRSWAFRVATNETFRYLKREARWSEQVRDEDTLKAIPSPPPREQFAAELLERLPLMVGKISPASRAVIALYYLHEMSFEEVAEVLAIPVGTVKSRLAYGLESLRQQFRKTTLN